MQAVNPDQINHSTDYNRAVFISVEWLLYATLLIFAILLQTANLGEVVMEPSEATRALPAVHALYPDAPGTPQPANSPIVFWGQLLSFSVLGVSEASSRIPGVFGGVILIFMPLLYRHQIGIEKSLWISALLAASPVVFTAARQSDPAVWTMIFALGMLRAFWQYWESQEETDALTALVFLGAMAFLSEPGGLILGLILMLSFIGTIWWMALRAPEDLDRSGDELIQSSREWFRSLPLYKGSVMSLFIIVIMSTGFMTMPSGLDSVAQVIRGALSGFWQPAQSGSPFAFGALSLLIYEPLLLLLGLTSGVTLVVNQRATFIDRFTIVWAGIAFVFLLLYRGSTPASGLWMSLPLTWLAVRLIAEMTIYYTPDGIPGQHRRYSDEQRFWWLKWLIALLMLTLLLMLSVHLLDIGRGLLNLSQAESLTQLLRDPRFILLSRGTMWSVFSVIIMAVAYFILSSFWGYTNTIQGFGLGFVLFMLIAGIGTGWNTAVSNAENPYELWHPSSTSADAYLLRETLWEIAERDTKGFPLIPISIVQGGDDLIRDDGLLAWLIRDFPNARFVPTLEDAQRAGIILLPASDELPDLGGSYVGQSFSIHQQWKLDSLHPQEVLRWLGQRVVASSDTVQQSVFVLWLRIDVYDGIPVDQRIGG